MGEHLLPVIAETMPVFVLQSRFDSSNVRNLGWTDIEFFGSEVERRLATAEDDLRDDRAEDERAPFGIFLDACFHHCMKWDSPISIDGSSQPVAFSKFMSAVEEWNVSRSTNSTGNASNATVPKRIWLQQDYGAVNLPCKDCCIGVEHAEM